MASLEPLDIIVKVQQKEELERLTLAAQKATGEIVKLNKQLQDGILNQAQFNAQAKQYAVTVSNLVPQIQALEQSGAKAGQGFAQLAYAIDDVQYGFNAIVNNIPQIVMGMGYGAGVAGAIGIAAVAVNQLAKHWEFFASAEWTETAARAKEGADAFAEMAKKLNEVAEARAKAFGTDTANAPGGAKGMATAIAAAMANNLGAHLPDDKGPLPMLRAVIGMLPTAGAKTLSTAQELAGRADQGDEGALRDLRRLVKENTKDFTVEQAAAINRDPVAEKQKRDELQGGRNARQIMESQKEEARVRQRQQEDWEHKGRHNERDINKKQFELNKKKQLQALQDQEEILREREHKIRFDAQMNKHGSAGGKGLAGVFADLRQGAFEAGGEAVGKQQLKKLEGIHQELKDLNKKKQGIQRTEFG